MVTCECHGEWKLTGPATYGNTQWMSGSIRLNVPSLELTFRKHVRPDPPSFIFNLFKKKMRSLKIKPERLVITLEDGGIAQLSHPLNPNDYQKICCELDVLLKKTVSGDLAKPGRSVDKSPRFSAQAAHQFTGVKSRSGNVSDDQDADLQKTPTGNKFLDRSKQKSAKTLAASFYGNTTPSSHNHGNAYLPQSAPPSFRLTKRRPGFLSDITSKKVNYTWQREKTTPTKGPVLSPNSLQGFSNLGNTCYMNAILQSLFSIESFANDLEKISNDLETKSPGKKPSGLLSGLSRLLRAHRSGASWEKLSLLLVHVKKAISAKRFLGNEQHDAHEFLSQVLDQLKEEVIALNKQMAVSNDLSASPMTSADDTQVKNPILLNFEFKVVHTITCCQCAERVVKEETFNDLSLDLPRRKDLFEEKTLQDALEQFFRPEKIDYACEKCESKEAKVSHEFTSLPRVLIVHLKRYVFLSSSALQGKLGRQIGVPRYLCLHGQSNQRANPPQPLHSSTDNKLKSQCKAATSIDYRCMDATSIEHQENVKPFSDVSVTPKGRDFKFRYPKRPVPPDMSSEDPEQYESLGKRRKESGVNTDSVSNQPANDQLSEFHLEGVSEEEQLKMALRLSTSEAVKELQFTSDSNQNLVKPSWQQRGPIMGQVDGTRDISPEVKTHAEHERYDLFLERSSSSSSSEEETGVSEGDHRIKRLVQVDGHTDPNDGLSDPEEDLGGDDSRHNSDASSQVHNSSHSSVKTNPATSVKMDLSAATFQDVLLEKPSSASRGTSSDDFTGVQTENEVEGVINTQFTHCKSTAGVNDGGTEAWEGCESSPHEVDHDYGASVTRRGVEAHGADETEQGPANEVPQEKEEKADELEEALERSRIDQAREEEEFQAALERAKEMSLMEFESVTEEQMMGDVEEGENTLMDHHADDTEWQVKVKENAKTGDLKNSYCLASVVSHLGSSTKVGHYVSDIYNMNKKAWFTCDDSTVRPTTEDKVLSGCQRTGYIFFYIHKDLHDQLSCAPRLPHQTHSANRVPLSPSRPNAVRNRLPHR